MHKTRVILFVLIISILSAAIFSFVFFQKESLIRQWNTTIAPPGFHDSRQFAWASESYAKGYDPLIENPTNPAGHQLNYPRIWHVFFHLGINESHTNIIGTIVVLLFFIGMGIFWFSRQYDLLTYLVLCAAFLSPAVMLGINRSNIELILFSIVAAAIAAGYRSSIASLAILLFGAVLKLYPIFGLIYLVREQPRRFWTMFLAGIGLFILYGLISLNDFLQVFSTTPKLVNSSHGINVWWMGLKHPRVFAIPLSDSTEYIFQLSTYVMAISILLTTLLFGTSNNAPAHYRQGQHLDAFRMGAAIYVGCFLLMNTHDYRLIYLIFTVPQLISWYRDSEYRINSIPAITIIAMGLSLWSFFIMRFLGRPVTFVIEESANWVMLYTLLYLLISSAPDWLKRYVRKPDSITGSSSAKNTVGM